MSAQSQQTNNKRPRKGAGIIKLVLGVAVCALLDQMGLLDLSMMGVTVLMVALLSAYELYRAVYEYWFAEKQDRISTAAFLIHVSGAVIFACAAALVWRGVGARGGLLLGVVVIVVFVVIQIRRGVETFILRLQLRRAISKGNMDRVKKLSFMLFNRMVVKRLVDDSRSAKSSFVKSAKLLGEVKELEGDYQAASWFYGWALDDGGLPELVHAESPLLTAKQASELIDTLCCKIRVVSFVAPQDTELYLKLAEVLIQYSPKDMAKIIMVGGMRATVENYTGLTLSEEILHRRMNTHSSGQQKFDGSLCAFHLARSYAMRGKTDESLDVLQSLNSRLRDSLDIRDALLRIEVEELRADLLDRKGQFEHAFKVFFDLMVQVEDQLTGIAKHLNEAALLSLSEKSSRMMSRYVGFLSERFPDDANRRISAFQAVVRFKGIAARVRLNVSRAFSPALDDDFKSVTLKAIELRRELADFWVDPSKVGQEFELKRFELTRLEAFLIKERLGDKWFEEQLVNDISQLKATLLPGEHAVEIVKARCSGRIDRYVSFSFTSVPDTLRLLDLGPCIEIDDAIAKWRELVQLGVHPDLTNDATATIQQRLVEPLLKLDEKTERFIVALDGEIGAIPLEAFFDLDGKGLLERFEWLYMSSLSELLRRQEPISRGTTRNVVVASPDFDWTPNKTNGTSQDGEIAFEKLPGAEREGKAVAELLGDTDLYIDASATVPRLKAIRNPRVLHIASHAFADSDATDSEDKDPLARCGIALAGINAVLRGDPPSSECEDGILSALEAAALDLKGTSLVVLSACDTGRGKLHHGEGVLGLRRAFMIAGARTIIASLWPVPDEQTRELMVAFYKGVIDGKTYADALRHAKLAVRRRHSSPFFWSAFVCYGLGTERLN